VRFDSAHLFRIRQDLTIAGAIEERQERRYLGACQRLVPGLQVKKRPEWRLIVKSLLHLDPDCGSAR
jgi:hypothetical protein